MPPNRPSNARLITACVSLMLACAGLGAFGACNLGLVEGAQTGKPGNNFFFPALFGGLLLGLVVALWDKLWAKFPSPLWRGFLLRSSYAGVLLVVAILSFRADWTTAHNWTPVRIPLRFDKKNTVTATFTAELSTTYHVQIDLKRNLPFEDIKAFVGGWTDEDKPPHRGPARPEIIWTVNPVKEADKSTYWSDISWGETVGLGIGEFQAVKRQKYTVTAQVVKPSPKAQILDPYLEVAIDYSITPSYYVPQIFAEIGGIIAGILGTILMIYSLIMLRYERKAAQVAEANGNLLP